MKSQLRTSAYVGVTAAAKGAGLLREFLLLSAVGIGAELDALVFHLAVPGIIAVLVASIIYTEVTPRAAKAIGAPKPSHANPGGPGDHGSLDPIEDCERARSAVGQLIGESLIVGAAMTAVAAIMNLGLALLIGSGGYIVAVVVSSTVIFTVMAEYLAATLTALRQVGFLVAGNLFISAPAIAALLLFDLTVESYAIVFALSFAFRAAYLALAIRTRIRFGAQHFGGRVVLDRSAWRLGSAASGSAVIAVQVSIQVATLLCRALPEGSTTLFYYGLRLPQLYLSSAWFVFTVDFFGAIQRLDASAMRLRFRQVARHNLAVLALAYPVGAVLLASADVLIPDGLTDLRLDEIVRLSLFCLPMIVFVPVIDMAQKVLATLGAGQRTARIAAGVLTTGVSLAGIVVIAGDRVEAVLVAVTVGLLVGALVAVRQTDHAVVTSSRSVDPSVTP